MASATDSFGETVVETKPLSIVASVLGQTACFALSIAVYNASAQVSYLRMDEPAPLPEQMHRIREELQARWTVEEAVLPEAIRARLIKTDQSLDSLGQLLTVAGGSQDDRMVRSEFQRLLCHRAYVMSAHLTEKTGPAHVSRPETQAKLKAIADTYPDVTRKGLLDFFQRIEYDARPAAFFYGTSGTGKSTTIRRLGEALDRPVLNCNFEEFMTPGFFGTIGEWPWAASSEDLGRLAGPYFAELISRGRSDVIVSIDESNFGDDPGSPVIQRLKILMDPDNRNFFLNGIPQTISAIFLFNGNFPNDTIQPLRERVPQIDFHFEKPQSWRLPGRSLRRCSHQRSANRQKRRTK